MIETRPSEAWSTYRINDEVSVLVKYSLNVRTLKRENGKAWQFIFSSDQMRQLLNRATWAALVCGGKAVSGGDMEVCLLNPEQLGQILDLSSNTQQSVTVKRIGGRSLRALSARLREELIIPRNRVDTWALPGS